LSDGLAIRACEKLRDRTTKRLEAEVASGIKRPLAPKEKSNGTQDHARR
jgi:hypothetical protein